MSAKKDSEIPAEQLEAAFGKKRTKRILKDIADLKKKNPKKAFSFIFAEDGSFTYIEKKNDSDQEN